MHELAAKPKQPPSNRVFKKRHKSPSRTNWVSMDRNDEPCLAEEVYFSTHEMFPVRQMPEHMHTSWLHQYEICVLCIPPKRVLTYSPIS
jgi:hypothetical protein